MDSHSSPCIDFTPQDDAFFAEGEQLADNQPDESFDDLDEGYRQTSFWDRIRRR